MRACTSAASSPFRPHILLPPSPSFLNLPPGIGGEWIENRWNLGCEENADMGGGLTYFRIQAADVTVEVLKEDRY